MSLRSSNLISLLDRAARYGSIPAVIHLMPRRIIRALINLFRGSANRSAVPIGDDPHLTGQQGVEVQDEQTWAQAQNVQQNRAELHKRYIDDLAKKGDPVRLST
jgi:hypothetical protein